MNVYKLFENLKKQPKDFVSAAKGKEFEERIQERLDRLGYSRILKDDIDKNLFGKLKNDILEKLSQDTIKNLTDYKRHFIRQPYGSQNYPDFIVFDGSKILPIEVKFTKKSAVKPMWNSGLPRPNGIYIFGSYAKGDLTFFRGADVVSLAEAKKLRAFFDNQLKKEEKEFNQREMKNQKRGFVAYVRRAFDQSKKSLNKEALVDYFTHPEREKVEQGVIDYIKKL